MPRMAQAHDWQGRSLIDSADEQLGKIRAVYLDDETDVPEWATVKLGLLGTERHVPLAGACLVEQDIRTRVSGEQIKSAPTVDPGGVLTEYDEAALTEHYGLPGRGNGRVPAV